MPINYYGYAPGNGALWLWWWMAPSHSELYVNLGALPAWLLLGLAAGAVARQLGASRHWPLAVFLTLNVPAVVRFAATQYVDIPTAACLVAAASLGLAWLRAPRWAEALLAGAALGLAAGTKVLGVFYGAALAVALLAAARGEWRRRLPQAAAALAARRALGGFFYARNLALGADPLAAVCEGTARGEPPERGRRAAARRLGRDLPRAMLAEGQLLDASSGSPCRRRSSWASGRRPSSSSPPFGAALGAGAGAPARGAGRPRPGPPPPRLLAHRRLRRATATSSPTRATCWRRWRSSSPPAWRSPKRAASPTAGCASSPWRSSSRAC